MTRASMKYRSMRQKYVDIGYALIRASIHTKSVHYNYITIQVINYSSSAPHVGIMQKN